MNITKKELKTALTTEREKLITLISEATEEQMNQPSLCEGWTNKNVAGHILGYELGYKDAIKLIFGKDSLDAINDNQAKRYEKYTNKELVELLRKGQKRVSKLLFFTPISILNKKIIPVPNGKISLSQLFGDLAMDRAVHYLDIANPLHNVDSITNKNSLSVSVQFVLKSIDLLNSSIPNKFHGNIVHIKLHGDFEKEVYWIIGSQEAVNEPPNGKTSMTITGDSQDFLFSIVKREKLLKNGIGLDGNSELKMIFNESLNANRLWDV